MKYTFFGRDYFSNSGAFDFTPDHYSTLLKRCSQYTTYFSLQIHGEHTLFQRELRKWEIEKPDFPYQGESHPENRHYYRLCPESFELLSRITDNFFEFDYTCEHPYPEDPAFYRSDGTVFMDVIAHEWECNIYPLPEENVDDVLAFGHWLNMVGGSVFEEGKPRAPASEHQLPISPTWNILGDPVYEVLRAIQKAPELHIGTKSVDAMLHYVNGYCLGMSDHVQTLRLRTFLAYRPRWYSAFELYVQGQCGAMTNDTLGDALQQAGFPGEKGFVQFFALLDQFIALAKQA